MIGPIHTSKRPLLLAAAGLTVALMAAGCDAAKPTIDAKAPADATAEVKMLAPVLPINAVMVSLVDFSADGIWRPAAAKTLTDRDWLLVQQDASNLAAAASLISVPGSGPNDAHWIADPQWRPWVADIQKTALAALDAAKAKDQPALAKAGDHLVEVCQACHTKLKPGMPPSGVTRFPYYPKRVADVLAK